MRVDGSRQPRSTTMGELIVGLMQISSRSAGIVGDRLVDPGRPGNSLARGVSRVQCNSIWEDPDDSRACPQPSSLHEHFGLAPLADHSRRIILFALATQGPAAPIPSPCNQQSRQRTRILVSDSFSGMAVG